MALRLELGFFKHILDYHMAISFRKIEYTPTFQKEEPEKFLQIFLEKYRPFRPRDCQDLTITEYTHTQFASSFQILNQMRH